MLIERVIQIARHRNGVGGRYFHAVLFDYVDADEGRTLRMVATVFPEPGYVAVLEVGSLSEIGPEPGKRGVMVGLYPDGNSWRGDHFERELRVVVAEYERIRDSALRAAARKP